MKGKITYGRDGSKTYFINGVESSKEEFEEAFPPKPFGVPGAPSLTGWPKISDVAGVHRSQVEEVAEYDRKNGVPTDYTPDGAVIFRDRGHRRDYMKLHGIHDRQGGYGDKT